MIDLDKLLQIFLSFSDSYEAINHKNRILKADTDTNKDVVNFIKNPNCTTGALLDLLLLYIRLEQDRSSDKGKKINPLMVINCFGHYVCKGDVSKIKQSLDSPESVDRVVEYYSKVLRMMEHPSKSLSRNSALSTNFGMSDVAPDEAQKLPNSLALSELIRLYGL